MQLTQVIHNIEKKDYRCDDINAILIELLVLHEKINKPDEQSQQFRHQLPQYREQLNELLREFEHMRNHLNRNNIEHMQNSIEEKQTLLNQFKSKQHLNTNDFLALSSLKTGIAFLQKQLASRQKYGHVHAFNYYIDHPHELLPFFE